VTAPADPRLGTRLAGYRIQALLGRGGMGVVYLAEQDRPHRQVALKLLLDPATASQAFRERFLRESELAAAIDHPNVLPVYDAGDTDGVLWIAMRYVDGVDLAALLAKDGPLAPEQALAIAGQVAGALDAAHTRGLVHRDVKPGNILLAVEDGAVTHAYLADFGLTKRVGGARGLTVSGQVLGTIDYVAPEQVEGGQVDGRADQYALGCVLFECLTGTVPFRRDSELAVLWAHVHDPPPRISEHRPDLPAGLDDVIGRALAKAPGDRYPSCTALVAATQAALARAAPAGLRHRLGRPVGRRAGRGRRRPGLPGLTRRSSLVLTITAAVLSAVLLVVAVLLARDGRAPTGPTATAVVAAANQAVRIDPATYQEVAAVAVGTNPAAVAAGGGSVWVANRQDGTVTVINPATNQVQDTLPASGSGPVDQGGPGLAFASGSLWVANTTQRQVTRVEPGGDPADIPVEASPNAVAAAPDADSVWVAAGIESGGGLLARIDAGSNQVAQRIKVRHAPTGLAITPDGRTVWLATPDDRAIYRIDTRTSNARRAELPLVPDQVAFGGGAVWVTSSESDAVLRINPTTSTVQATIRVGKGPGGIAFGAGRVWVANRQDGTVSVIDPQSNEVGTLHLGFRPVAVAAEQGAVWVALAA
jgi:YVTN family beta-propeller protein